MHKKNMSARESVDVVQVSEVPLRYEAGHHYWYLATIAGKNPGVDGNLDAIKGRYGFFLFIFD